VKAFKSAVAPLAARLITDGYCVVALEREAVGPLFDAREWWVWPCWLGGSWAAAPPLAPLTRALWTVMVALGAACLHAHCSMHSSRSRLSPTLSPMFSMRAYLQWHHHHISPPAAAPQHVARPTRQPGLQAARPPLGPCGPGAAAAGAAAAAGQQVGAGLCNAPQLNGA
jgi:hypothetical protein